MNVMKTTMCKPLASICGLASDVVAEHLPQSSRVVLLGNAGVGKSFLCNLLLEYEAFDSQWGLRAVTRQTEIRCVRVKLRHREALLDVCNVPGLLDLDRAQLQRNKHEISRVFDGTPTYVFIVLCTEAGRPRREDIMAINVFKESLTLTNLNVGIILNNPRAMDRIPADFLAAFRNRIHECTGLRPAIVQVPCIEGCGARWRKRDATRQILLSMKSMEPVSKRDVFLELPEEKEERGIAELTRRLHQVRRSIEELPRAPATSSVQSASNAEAGDCILMFRVSLFRPS